MDWRERKERSEGRRRLGDAVLRAPSPSTPPPSPPLLRSRPAHSHARRAFRPDPPSQGAPCVPLYDHRVGRRPRPGEGWCVEGESGGGGSASSAAPPMRVDEDSAHAPAPRERAHSPPPPLTRLHLFPTHTDAAPTQEARLRDPAPAGRARPGQARRRFCIAGQRRPLAPVSDGLGRDRLGQRVSLVTGGWSGLSGSGRGPKGGAPSPWRAGGRRGAAAARTAAADGSPRPSRPQPVPSPLPPSQTAVTRPRPAPTPAPPHPPRNDWWRACGHPYHPRPRPTMPPGMVAS